MNVPFVDLHAQYESIKTEIDTAIHNVIRDTAFIGGSNNKYVQNFEEAFKAYLGIDDVMTCANGTDSLEILLSAYGIGKGDEVIVPAMTWISTAEAVNTVGATPVFVDIEAEYYTINPALIEAKINANTKAIIPVHLYGQPADMDAIMAIAAKHNLIVIEDCAQSHGAMYKGKMVGTIGHASSFSFYPGKNLGAYGDAGCMATNDKAIAETCRMIANHGQKGKHNHLIPGRNSRLDGIHAAILSVKLPFLPKWTEERIAVAAYYENNFKDIVVTPATRPGCQHVFHLYVIQTEDRAQVVKELKEKGIETAVHYPTALPFLPVYATSETQPSDYPVAAVFQHRILSIPMYPELGQSQQDWVIQSFSYAGTEV